MNFLTAFQLNKFINLKIYTKNSSLEKKIKIEQILMKVDPFRAILNIYMAVNSLFLFKSSLTLFISSVIQLNIRVI